MKEESPNTRKQPSTNVIYVKKRNAKSLKVALEAKALLDRNYRMVPAHTSCFDLATPILQNIPINVVNMSGSVPLDLSQNSHSHLEVTANDCIAIPVITQCTSVINSSDGTEGWMEDIIATGEQPCPFSSSILGNTKKGMEFSTQRKSYSDCSNEGTSTVIQNVLIKLIVDSPSPCNLENVEEYVKSLSIVTCPKKLEIFGDDRTLVIPNRALNPTFDDSLKSNLISSLSSEDSDDGCVDKFMNVLWLKLAKVYKSPRVVRRGDVDPNSKIRESGHSILWLDDGIDHFKSPFDESKGWITVTEQKVKQSFDLTKVMFSRGNISEKIRFGKVVCEDEIVLDMYAGIGYYTLPALVHGNAKHVYACEWNEYAAGALRYNLSQNGVSDRATVFVGDCRKSFRENEALKIGFDRISLGLLPSSEGGWKTAVQALHISKGGWLHVHGNVPTLDRENWGLWLCQRLLNLRDEWGGDRVKSHVVLCQHIERVKSFAPKIEHFVADIFLGPKERLFDHLAHINMNGHRSGIIQQTGEFRPVIGIVDNPSCALGEGILHQKWMMSDEDSHL